MTLAVRERAAAPVRTAPRPGPGARRGERSQAAVTVRVAAVAAVIVVHAANWPSHQGVPAYDVYTAVATLARFSVPAFVILAGYLYGRRDLGRPDPAYLVRRARRTVLPWLVWAPLYVFANLTVTGEVHRSAVAVGDWVSYGAGHLYFLLLIPQLYAVALLWPRGRRASWAAAAACVGAQVVLQWVRLYVPLHGSVLRELTLWHGFQLFPFWVGYLALGIVAGRAWRHRGAPPARLAVPLLLATAVAAAAMVRIVPDASGDGSFAQGTGAFLRPLMLPYTLLMCATVAVAAPALLRTGGRFWTAVDRHSLGIYVVHPLLLFGVGRSLGWWLNRPLPVSLGALVVLFVCTFALSLGAISLVARTPLAWVVGETRPRRRQTAVA